MKRPFLKLHLHIFRGQKSSLLELCVWLGGIGALALMEPGGPHLFSFCPVSWIWAEGCWGCGLGHGIAYLFRGEWQASWQAHPLALPAVLVLLHRCMRLLRWQYDSVSKRTLHL